MSHLKYSVVGCITDRPARRLKRLVERQLPQKVFTEVLFLYAARADSLLYDFTTQAFWPAYRGGRSILTTDDVLAFLAEAADEGLINKPWSAQVQVKIARGVLSTLRDVGFLREEQRGRRQFVPYHLSDEGVAYLAYELHDEGLTDSAMCEHPDWKLFGLDSAGVLGRLDTPAGDKGVLVQRAGSIVRITWRYASVEELIDDLA